MHPTSDAFTDSRSGVMAVLLLAALAVALLLEAFLLIAVRAWSRWLDG